MKVTRKLLKDFGYDGWYSWVRRWIETSGLLTGKSGSQRELSPHASQEKLKNKREKTGKGKMTKILTLYVHV